MEIRPKPIHLAQRTGTATTARGKDTKSTPAPRSSTLSRGGQAIINRSTSPTKSKASSTSSASATKPAKKVTVKIPQRPSVLLEEALGRTPSLAPISVRDRALGALAAPPNQSECGKVLIKFNHYNKQFPVYNGVLKWSDVDEEYSFSFVYRGNYSRRIVTMDRTVEVEGDERGEYFLGLIVGNQYLVFVEEDPIAGIGAEGLRINHAPLLAGRTAGVSSGNTATKLITQELLAIPASQLGGREAKELIEQRDIEDILFSSST